MKYQTPVSVTGLPLTRYRLLACAPKIRMVTAQQTFSATLQPGATLPRTVTFPAGLLDPGTHILTVFGIDSAT